MRMKLKWSLLFECPEKGSRFAGMLQSGFSERIQGSPENVNTHGADTELHCLGIPVLSEIS